MSNQIMKSTSASSAGTTGLSISRMMFLAAIAIIGMVASFSVYNGSTFLEHRIGGERFHRILDGHDLIADYLPPPLLPYQAFTLVHLTRDTADGDVNKQISKWKELHQSFDERLAHWDNVMAEKPFLDEAKWKDFRDGLAVNGKEFWDQLEGKVIPALQAKDLEKADAAIEELTSRFVKHAKMVEDTHSFIDESLTRDEESSRAASDFAMATSTVVAISLCVLLALIFFLGNRLVVRAIAEISAVMSKLAGGDLQVAVPYETRRDEVGAMARAVSVFREQAQANHAAKAANEYVIENLGAGLEKMSRGDLTTKISAPFPETLDALRISYNETVEALQGIILSVRTGADSISSGSAEISLASDDLSRRTENQAANLEQTAAAVAEITNKVKETAAGAVHARNAVALARDNANTSGEIVDRAVAAMKAIENTSQKITQIISVMDEIAFQTNLLALNAGVEAARAGEAGRGFAVVASEVRALAQRSAEAAKEIKALLMSSQSAVDDGVHLVAETGTSLRSIIQRITEISDIISDIAASAEHQASGLQEVNTAVEQMDMVTQQNAAMVEETTAATRTLTQQSSDLAGIVARFTLAQAARLKAVEQNNRLAA